MTHNPFSLVGKNILVTGASSGIGKGIALACASMGATLIINGRNTERLEETLELLERNNHIAIAADISSPEGIKDLVNRLPKLDGVALAAGIVEMLPVLFATKDKFQKIYDTNLFAPIELIRLIVKKKLYNPGLSIAIIDSIAGKTDISTANGIYGSGKAALASYSKYMALELASKKIRVNTISPGMILTPMHTEGVVDNEQLQTNIDKIPIKRWGTPEDIANGAIYLLSDASSYITGTDLCIDGGLTI